MVSIKEEIEQYNAELEDIMEIAKDMQSKFRFDIGIFLAWRASKHDQREEYSA